MSTPSRCAMRCDAARCRECTGQAEIRILTWRGGANLLHQPREAPSGQSGDALSNTDGCSRCEWQVGPDAGAPDVTKKAASESGDSRPGGGAVLTLQFNEGLKPKSGLSAQLGGQVRILQEPLLQGRILSK